MPVVPALWRDESEGSMGQKDLQFKVIGLGKMRPYVNFTSNKLSMAANFPLLASFASLKDSRFKPS